MARTFEWVRRRWILTGNFNSGFEPLFEDPIVEPFTLERVTVDLWAFLPQLVDSEGENIALAATFMHAIEVTVGTGGAGPPIPAILSVNTDFTARDFLWTGARKAQEGIAFFRATRVPDDGRITVDTGTRRRPTGDEQLGVWWVWDVNSSNIAVGQRWTGSVNVLVSQPA